MSKDWGESINFQGVDAGVHRCSTLARIVGKRLGWLQTAWLLLVVWLAPASAEVTSPGVYTGQMCVLPLHSAHSAGDCGPVEILLQNERQANLRISDIVYRLELDRGQLSVVLMHGTMQIDGFTAPYEWQGTTLSFSDAEKGRRYQIHFKPTAANATR